jgi:hypothetical protein
MKNSLLLLATVLHLTAPVTLRAATVSNNYFRIETTASGVAAAFDPRGEAKHGEIQAWLGPWGTASVGEISASANGVQVRGARYRNLEVGTGGYSGNFDGADGLAPAGRLGQSFRIAPGQGLLHAVSIFVSGQGFKDTAVTMTLRRDGPQGLILAQRRVSPVPENFNLPLKLSEPVGPGTYYVEITDGTGPVVWWRNLTDRYAEGTAVTDGQPVPAGDRVFSFQLADEGEMDWSVELDGDSLRISQRIVNHACDKHQPSLALSLPWQKDGFDTADPRITPFKQIVTDTGYFLPVEAFKRLSWDWALDVGSKEALVHGSYGYNLRLAHGRSLFAARMDSDRIHLLLGNDARVAVLTGPNPMPDYFPRFFCSDESLNERLNRFLWTFQFSHTSTPCTFNFDAAKLCWTSSPIRDSFKRVMLHFTHTMGEDGYIWSRGESRGWDGSNDLGLFENNSAWIMACWRMYCWTGDREMLDAAMPTVRKAIAFQLEKLRGREGLLALSDPRYSGIPSSSRACNYFDCLPTGGLDAYLNTFWLPTLQAAAELERETGNKSRADELEAIVPLARKRFNETFWDETKGRYISWIDTAGIRHDCGMTYVNTMAAVHGLAERGQVEKMFRWMTTEPTHSGQADTFSRWIFAPRSNTIHCSEQRNKYPYDEWCEDGGAILWTAFYEIMARACYLNPDDAWKRYGEILDRYAMPDHLVGGNPLYRGEVNNHSGDLGSVGLWGDFPESGLAPCAFLYAFLGLRADSSGLYMQPRLPSGLSFAGVEGLSYRGRTLAITAWKDRIEVRSKDGARTIEYKPGAEVRLAASHE